MANEEKIAELNEKSNDLWEQIHSIRKEITRLSLEGINYEGKYIYIPDYGYMYVTWQELDTSHNMYSDDRMFFQGYSFDCEITDYTDMFNIYCTALRDIYISVETFRQYHNEGKIKVITKQEFIKKQREFIENYLKECDSMLEAIEENYTNKTKKS